MVEQLSSFEGLETVESCEGPPAWVCFRFGPYWDRPWQDLAAFVFGKLGPHLSDRLGDRVNLQAFRSGSGEAMGELTVREGAMAATLNALAELEEC